MVYIFRGLMNSDAVSPSRDLPASHRACWTNPAYLGDADFGQAGETKVGSPFLGLELFRVGSLFMAGKEIHGLFPPLKESKQYKIQNYRCEKCSFIFQASKIKSHT